MGNYNDYLGGLISFEEYVGTEMAVCWNALNGKPLLVDEPEGETYTDVIGKRTWTDLGEWILLCYAELDSGYEVFEFVDQCIPEITVQEFDRAIEAALETKLAKGISALLNERRLKADLDRLEQLRTTGTKPERLLVPKKLVREFFDCSERSAQTKADEADFMERKNGKYYVNRNAPEAKWFIDRIPNNHHSD